MCYTLHKTLADAEGFNVPVSLPTTRGSPVNHTGKGASIGMNEHRHIRIGDHSTAPSAIYLVLLLIGVTLDRRETSVVEMVEIKRPETRNLRTKIYHRMRNLCTKVAKKLKINRSVSLYTQRVRHYSPEFPPFLPLLSSIPTIVDLPRNYPYHFFNPKNYPYHFLHSH